MRLTFDPPKHLRRVKCELCGAETTSIESKRCDRCWKLETMISWNPDIARRILDKVEESNE